MRLVHGDLFDGPADLIVLPCSTAGTVTEQVRRRLQQFFLPPAPARMELGEVDIQPLADAEQLAQYVAFAASVAGMRSDTGAIARIGEALGRATKDLPTIGSVSVPLVGTGAGSLLPSQVVPELRRGFEKAASPKAVLSIFVLREDVYSDLSSTFPRTERHLQSDLVPDWASPVPPGRSATAASATASSPTPPRVFISHSALSSERASWLDALYRFLRANGVNARIDAHSARPGMDIVQWMCNELQQADRVLLICDERYADRADGRHGGVGWETMLIQGDLYAATYGTESGDATSGSKYIPVVLTDHIDDGRPVFLKTKLVLHWPPNADEENLRRDLLKELFGVSTEPPIGPPPTFL